MFEWLWQWLQHAEVAQGFNQDQVRPALYLPKSPNSSNLPLVLGWQGKTTFDSTLFNALKMPLSLSALSVFSALWTVKTMKGSFSPSRSTTSSLFTSFSRLWMLSYMVSPTRWTLLFSIPSISSCLLQFSDTVNNILEQWSVNRLLTSSGIPISKLLAPAST